MKNCTDCSYAEWDRTKAGRLHPSGEGRCNYPYKIPELPACMYWVGHNRPKPYGGYINMRDELKKDCVYFQRKRDSMPVEYGR